MFNGYSRLTEKDLDNYEVVRQYIRDNVYTLEEAAAFLGVSRQTLKRYVSEGKVEVLKEIGRVLLFFEGDLNALRENMYSFTKLNNFFITKKIFGERNSYRAEEEFREMFKGREDDIVSIKIYFEHFDAVLDNYFRVIDSYKENKKLRVEVPSFIVKLKDGEEVWFKNMNCGYGGTGPNTSIRALKFLGVDEKLLEKVYYARIIEFYVEDGEWGCSVIRERDSRSELKEMDNLSIDYCVFNNNLVYAPGAYTGRDLCDDDEKIKKFIMTAAKFISKPAKIILLSRKRAIETGHYSDSMYRTLAYQMIIVDTCGREIWVPCYFDLSKSLSVQGRINDLLRFCGVEINPLSEFAENAKNWLKQGVVVEREFEMG